MGAITSTTESWNTHKFSEVESHIKGSYLPLAGGTMSGIPTAYYYYFRPQTGTTTNAGYIGCGAGGSNDVYLQATTKKIYTNSQIISDITTGTAPFVVNSTTKVENLHADLLDGYNAVDFALTGHTHSYLPLSGGTMSGGIKFSNNVEIKNKNDITQIHINEAYAIFGYGNPPNQIPTYIDGYEVNLRCGSSYTTAIKCNSSGNVGIGTTSPVYQLHVGGNIAIGNNGSNARIGTPYSVNDNNIYNYITFYGNGEGDSHHDGSIIYTAGKWTSDVAGYSTTVCHRFDVFVGTAMSINNGGYIGMGTTAPSYKLHVSGSIYATGGITSASDERMKNVIGDTKLSLEQIANAPAVKFTWKDSHEEGEQVGTIAQYWQSVLPQVVKDKSGELSLQYGVTALISSITTARDVVVMKEDIKKLEERISELEK